LKCKASEVLELLFSYRRKPIEAKTKTQLIGLAFIYFTSIAVPFKKRTLLRFEDKLKKKSAYVA